MDDTDTNQAASTSSWRGGSPAGEEALLIRLFSRSGSLGLVDIQTLIFQPPINWQWHSRCLCRQNNRVSSIWSNSPGISLLGNWGKVRFSITVQYYNMQLCATPKCGDQGELVWGVCQSKPKIIDVRLSDGALPVVMENRWTQCTINIDERLLGPQEGSFPCMHVVFHAPLKHSSSECAP